MMNTLRRKSFLRQNSRPSLISFNKHDSGNFSGTAQDCEPLRNIHSDTHNAQYNVPQHDHNHQLYSNANTNNKSKNSNSVPKHHRNCELDFQDEGGFRPVKKQARHSTQLEYENSQNSYYPTRTPYYRHDSSLSNNNNNINQEFLSNNRDYSDSRYDQEQRCPTHSYDKRKTETGQHGNTTAQDCYDIRKPDQRKTDQRKRSTSLLQKNSSFRQYLGYPLNSNNSSAARVQQTAPASVSRSVGGVVKRRKHVVLLGLDGAGKTTILLRLKYRCYVATTPTVGFNHEKVWGGGFRWSAWDVGGGERVRPLWGTYTRAMDGIVFVVNSAANDDTIEETRLELTRILKLSKATATQLGRAAPPLLVLANFQDERHARNAPELAKSLCLPQEGHSAYSNTSVVTANWAVVCVCGITGEGLDEALNTFRQLMDQRKLHNTKTRSKVLDRWR